jgi:hypothetical protein
LHRGLGPLLACRPDGPWLSPIRGSRAARAAWIESIRAAGGDVIEDAGIVSIEIEDGRAAAVMTGHGREHAAALVADLGATRTATLLPPDPDADADPSVFDVADVVHVELVAATDLPPLLVAAGDASRIRGAPDDRTWVTFAGPDLAAHDDAVLLNRARAAHPALASGAPRAVVRVPGGMPRPAARTEGVAFRWLRRLATVGILPVGPRALHVPMLARDVVDTTVAVLDGVPPVAVRGGRLGLTPSRPWVLVQ